MRRRAALARAFARAPQVLLMDEPFSALGDRIVVTSSGPGRIIAEVAVSLPRPHVVESSRVVDLAQHVRGLLDEANQLGITAPWEGKDGHVNI